MNKMKNLLFIETPRESNIKDGFGLKHKDDVTDVYISTRNVAKPKQTFVSQLAMEAVNLLTEIRDNVISGKDTKSFYYFNSDEFIIQTFFIIPDGWKDGVRFSRNVNAVRTRAYYYEFYHRNELTVEIAFYDDGMSLIKTMTEPRYGMVLAEVASLILVDPFEDELLVPKYVGNLKARSLRNLVVTAEEFYQNWKGSNLEIPETLCEEFKDFNRSEYVSGFDR